ncbi:MAG: PAS domain S-box protein [Acidobacteriota bacterium]|nr:PAS domain S-box protein [Acidobacteriota bacterium]
MGPGPSLERDSLILLHAPIGRDAPLLHDLFHHAHLTSQVCLSMDELCREVQRGVGAAFVAEEALDAKAIDDLSAVLRQQGPWSDLPLVVLTVGGEPTQASRERLAQLEPLGDLTLLERPLRSDTIVSAARTALRARARQYEVRRRDAELQLVTDHVPVLISYIDREQIYRRVNQTYFEWFGIQPQEVIGRTIKTVTGEPHYTIAQPFIARALRGERVDFESQLWDLQGAPRYVSVSYAPDIAPDGVTRGFVALVQDITERKRAERALRTSSERLRFLGELGEATRTLTGPAEVMAVIARMLGEHMHAAHCAYADVEPDSETFTLQHDYAADGYPSLVGKYRLSSFGPRVVEQMCAGKTLIIRDAAREFGLSDAAQSFLALGVQATVCCPLVKDGRLIAMMAVHQAEPRDWTPDDVELVETVVERSWAYIERARAQTELQESERQFRALADTIPNLAWMAHADGYIFWYNQRWYDYTGTTPDEMEGWGWQKVHDPEILPQVLESWKDCIATARPFEMVFPILGSDQILRPFLTRVVPVRDSSGTVVRWFGTNTDIDEQKRAEEALRKANRELEEFAYVASHDLQEPLRMVNVYTQLLLRRLGTEITPELKECAEYVRTGVKRMESLIQDLLTYSRVTHTGEGVTPDRANLEAALRQAIVMVDTRLQENQAEVTFDPLPVAVGDERQITHVFQNLLSNAVKYRKPEEPPRIHVGAERQDGHWVVSVKDNGIGFDQNQAERIFGLFKRLHRDDEYPGTGLGLAICKRIVERYQGRMWAESREGAGSTFFLSLPAAPDE